MKKVVTYGRIYFCYKNKLQETWCNQRVDRTIQVGLLLLSAKSFILTKIETFQATRGGDTHSITNAHYTRILFH